MDDVLSEIDKQRLHFINILIGAVFNPTVESMQSLVSIEATPPGIKAAQREYLQLYKALDNKQREILFGIISKTAELVLFDVLVMLDGASFGSAFEDVVADYAVYLQEYETWNDQRDDNSKSSTLINPHNYGNVTMDLHDLFLDRLSELSEAQEKT